MCAPRCFHACVGYTVTGEYENETYPLGFGNIVDMLAGNPGADAATAEIRATGDRQVQERERPGMHAKRGTGPVRRRIRRQEPTRSFGAGQGSRFGFVRRNFEVRSD